MARVISLAAAALSFISLVLVAIAMATNYWVRFDDREPDSNNPLNPIVMNEKFDGLPLRYDLDYFGLWVGCHRERRFDKVSCGYIGASCYSNICWIRNGEEEDEQCVDARVTAVSNCAAYQAVRLMTIIGTVFLIIGSSVLLVSVCVTSRNLTTSGALSTLFGGLFLMIAFIVFYENNYRRAGLPDIAGLRWSFILLIVSWPLALIAGLMGLASSSSEAKAAQEEAGDYEDSD